MHRRRRRRGGKMNASGSGQEAVPAHLPKCRNPAMDEEGQTERKEGFAGIDARLRKRNESKGSEPQGGQERSAIFEDIFEWRGRSSVSLWRESGVPDRQVRSLGDRVAQARTPDMSGPMSIGSTSRDRERRWQWWMWKEQNQEHTREKKVSYGEPDRAGYMEEEPIFTPYKIHADQGIPRTPACGEEMSLDVAKSVRAEDEMGSTMRVLAQRHKGIGGKGGEGRDADNDQERDEEKTREETQEDGREAKVRNRDESRDADNEGGRAIRRHATRAQGE
ncbi:hypothetical protein B0H14DRAFT_2656949 [Mycena olivaceomarginata]|nr:hypothetical protein B0H14DRAFT_2656949 [Mycena olivaceomarginata]